MTTTNNVRYPDCEVELIGKDGNAFVIVATVTKALRRFLRVEYDYTAQEIGAAIDEYTADAMSGDYDQLLATTMRYVSVR